MTTPNPSTVEIKAFVPARDFPPSDLSGALRRLARNMPRNAAAAP